MPDPMLDLPPPSAFAAVEDENPPDGLFLQTAKKYSFPVAFLTSLLKQFPSVRQAAIAQHGVDVTDPRVQLAGRSLTPEQHAVRAFRYAVESFKQSLLSPIGLGGIENAEAEGKLAEPQTVEEHILKFVTPMIAGTVQTLPLFGIGGAAEGVATTGRVATSVLGNLARRLSLAAGTRMVGEGAAAQVVPRLTPQAIQNLLLGIGFDVGAGAAGGVALAKAQAAKEGATPGTEADDTKAAIVGGLTGLVAGTLLRGFQVGNLARATYRMSRLSEGELLQVAPGDVINDKEAVVLGGKLKAKLLPTHPDFDPQHPDKLVDFTIEDVTAQVQQNLSQLKAQAATAAEAAAPAEAKAPSEAPAPSEAAPAAAQATPQAPASSLPFDPDQVLRLAALKANDPQFVKMVQAQARLGAVDRAVEEARLVAFDPTAPTGLRQAAAAHVRAVEEVLQRPPSFVPGSLDLERAAATFVQSQKARLPLEQVVLEAHRLAIRDPNLAPFAKQVATIVAEEQNQVIASANAKLREAAAQDLTQRLRAASQRLNRGFRRDMLALYQGQVVKVTAPPDFGRARIIPVNGGKSFVADVADLLPIPKSGTLVTLVDGTEAVAVRTNAHALKVEVLPIDGIEKGQSKIVPFSDIQSVGEKVKGSVAEKVREQLRVRPKTDDLQPLPATIPALTVEGQEVLIRKAGSEAVEVQTSRGATKVLPREAVEVPTSDPKVVGTFIPRTVPPKGMRLLYVAVPTGRTRVFEQSVAAGTIADEFGGIGHVLPQPYQRGFQLYAVEVPAQALKPSAYSATAKQVIRQAVKGQGTLASHESPVTLDPKQIARVYRVPKALQQTAIRSDASLSGLQGEDLARYVRHVMVLNERVEGEVAAETQAVRDAQAALSQAIKDNDGQAAVEAERQLIQAKGNAIKQAIVNARETTAKEVEQRTLAELSDPLSQEKMRLADGLYDETKEPLIVDRLERMIPLDSRGLGETLLWKAADGPEVAHVTKALVPGLDEAGKPTLIPKYRFQGYDAHGMPIPGAQYESNTPVGVMAAAIRHGFVPTLAEPLVGDEFVNMTNPALRLRVTPMPASGKVQVTMTERVEQAKSLHNITADLLAGVLGKDDDLVKVIAGKVVDDPHDTGILTTFREIGSKQMTVKQFREFVRREGYVQANPGATDALKRFQALPSVNEIQSPEALLSAVQDVADVLEDLPKTGVIPEPIQQYARELGKKYYDVTGRIPFRFDQRIRIGLYTVQDTYHEAAYGRGYTPFFDRLASGHAIIVDANPPQALAERAKQTGLAFETLKEWGETFEKLKLSESASPADVQPRPTALGRMTDTGRVVQILSVDLPGGTARVRYPDGQEFETTLAMVRPTTEPAVTNDWRLAELVEQGRYAEVFDNTIPPPGFGAVERALGVLGTRDRRVIQRAFDTRLSQILDRTDFAKRKFAFSVPNDAKELLDLHARAQELDMLEGAQATKVTFSDRVTTAIEQRFGKPAATAFKRLAYEDMKQRLGNTPLAELQARANAGWLKPDELESVRELAKTFGIPNPERFSQGALVHRLIAQRGVDAVAANISVDVAERGALLVHALDAAEGDPEWLSKVTVRLPKTSQDIFSSWFVGVPHKAAARQPTALLVQHAVDLAVNEQRRAMRVVELLQTQLQTLGVTEEQFNEAVRYLKQTPQWEDALAKAPEALRPAVQAIRDFTENLKLSMIRHFLRLGITPVRFDPENLEHVAWAASQRLSPSEAKTLAYIIPDIDDVLSTRQRVPIQRGLAWGEDKIDEFVTLFRTYQRVEDLPPDTPPEFIELFQFFKGWGLRNYFPLVHRGQHAILVDGKLTGWAPSKLDAVFIGRKLVAEEGIDPSRIAIEDRTKGGLFYDDILVRHAPSGRQFRETLDRLAEEAALTPEEIKSLLVVGTPNEQVYGITPLQVHAKPRTASLEPLFSTNWKDLSYYAARVARMEYHWRLLRALETLNDEGLDQALAQATHSPTLAELPRLRQMMEDRIRHAAGAQSKFEEVQDKLVAFLSFLGDLPANVRDAFFRGEQFLDPRDYYQKYAARKLGQQTTAWMASLKLFNFASPIVNLSQYFLLTIPKLQQLRPDVPAATVAADALKDWAEGVRWLRRFSTAKTLSPEDQAVKQFVEDLGIDLQPAKYAGVSDFKVTAGSFPTGFGRSKLEYADELFQYLTLFPFNATERMNRYATAMAGLRTTLRKYGLSSLAQASPAVRAEALATADQLIRDTMFLYDEFNLPMVMNELGPAGKVIFQFKPFVFNLLSYTKDLVAAAMRGDPGARKALATHLGLWTIAGGVSGILYHPVLAIPRAIIETLFPHTPDPRRIAQDLREKQQTSFEHALGIMPFTWSDVLFYGLPGLAGVSVGQRLGVSGQDLFFPIDNNAPLFGLLGPSGTMFADFAKVVAEFSKVKGNLPATTGMLLGAFAPAALNLTRLDPVATVATATLGGLAGERLLGHRDFTDFLSSSDAGRRFIQRNIPVTFKAAANTAHIFMDNGVIRDVNGRPTTIPTENRLREGIATALSFQTIRRDEEGAVISLAKALQEELVANRSTITAEAADAYEKGDYEHYYRILVQAMERGIDVPFESIQQELLRRSQSRLTTILKQMSPEVRKEVTGGGTTP